MSSNLPIIKSTYTYAPILMHMINRMTSINGINFDTLRLKLIK